MGEEKAIVLGENKRRQVWGLGSASQRLHYDYAYWKKTGRDCESRPNAPPTWGRFDKRNIAQPPYQIKQNSCLVNQKVIGLGSSVESRAFDPIFCHQASYHSSS